MDVGSDRPRSRSYNFKDRTQQQYIEASWSEDVELIHKVLTEIGAYQGWDDWVNHNNYPVYKERLARARDNFPNRYARTEEDRNYYAEVPTSCMNHPVNG